ncbi:hypothetical protein [Corynebacterium tapiri]|uniref:TOMM leader peptide-binding protein n=1 Tax=Corynebacterium tapiri TaxID=1448266 RepID=A0A5C4U3V1_9CORY|nr:hypothetical protein [Corynebacterium tapiri]TNL98393.1 hypothetical protein FHE74_04130 [Corynebacterium tapiri]
MDPSFAIKLRPGAQILTRGRTAVQCGLDASRAGIIECSRPSVVARALRTAHRPTDCRALSQRLVQAGLDVTTAEQIVEDLVSHGILRPARRASVAVVGSTALAEAIRELCAQTGFVVRRPLGSEPTWDFLRGLSPSTPAVLVDQWGSNIETRAMAVRTHPNTVTAAALDHRGLVGPVRLDGRGACPMCVELTWVRNDPLFHLMARELEQPDQDPLAISATAATATAVVGALVEARSTPEVGTCWVIDPYDPVAAHRFVLPPHPGCPICFAARVA